MSYEVFVVLGAAVDDSRERQKDVVVRFLGGVSGSVPQPVERDVRLGIIIRVVSILAMFKTTYFELSPSL